MGCGLSKVTGGWQAASTISTAIIEKLMRFGIKKKAFMN
jgi:hypothetical protein